MTHIRFPEAIKRALKIIAARQGKSMTQLLGEIAAEFVEKEGITLE